MTPKTSGKQVLRMLALVPYLQAHDGIPVNDLAREFGVTPKVIRKDLHQLMLTGVGEFPGELIDFDLSALEDDGVVFIRDAEFMSRPLRVNASEAAALIVALRTLRASASGSQVPIIDSALVKLEDVVGQSVSAPVDIHLESADPHIHSVLTGALHDGRRVEIQYATVSRDAQTVREVDPRRIFSEQGRLYLEAWCLLAEDLRFFRLDRILSARALDVPVEDHDVPARDLSDGIFTVGEQTPYAILDLFPRAHWLVEYYEAEVVERISDEVLRVKLHGGDLDWLRRLVLRNGGNVSVIEPADLRAQVADHARAALAAYDGDRSSTKE